jgi:hypothetical protein
MTTSGVLTVDQVIDRMIELQQSLPPSDGVAVFNRVYLEVTRLIRDRLATGFFADPATFGTLDAIFAGRYLAAVDTDAAGGRPAACWQPLFELRARPGIHPLQFALAGMNAHIEHDLPMSVVETCEQAGRQPADLRGDYERINELLAQLDARVREELLPEPAELRPADPLLHIVDVWSIDRARDAAWASVCSLWELRRAPLAYEAFTGALSGTVGMVSRALLTPLDGDGGA